MNTDIVILNTLKYYAKDKDGNKTDKVRTRLSYYFPILNNDDSNLKGYPEFTEFVDADITNILPSKIYGKQVKIKTTEVPQLSNPFKKRTIISSIEFEGRSYDFYS